MAAVAVAALLSASCAGAVTSSTGDVNRTSESPGVSRIAIGDRRLAPTLSGTTLQGTHFTLESLAGNVVVLNIWASWCAPCRDESPVLAGLDRKLAGQQVRFIGIDETDTAASAIQFVTTAGVTYPQLVDPDGALLRQLPLLPQKGMASSTGRRNTVLI